jgi:hypothetical protein
MIADSKSQMNVLRHSVVAAAILVGGAVWTIAPAVRVQAQAPAAAATSARGDASSPSTLLKQARDAEAAYQFDVALDRLYTLQLEQPRSSDALSGRLLLARLLTLVNDLPAAILQAQALSDEPSATAPQRAQALDLATAAGRRLRSVGVQYKATENAASKGLVELKEPTAIMPEQGGSFLIVDRGGKKVMRVADDTVSAVMAAQPEPTAAVQLPDGTLLVGVKPEKGKNGSIITQPAGKPVPVTFTEGGKMKPLTKVLAMAADSSGDVFIVAEDYNKGLLRCKAGAADCAPWGPPGELKTVKVGASDFVYTLDTDGKIIRVMDNSGKAMAALNQTLDAKAYSATIPNAAGTTYELKKIVDIAIDQTYTLYLLDAQQHKVVVVPLRLDAGRLTAEVRGEVNISTDASTPFGIKNPSAIAVTPSGALIVAGESTRLVRFR